MFGGCYPNPDSLQKSRGFFPIVFTPGVGTISFQKMSTRRRFFLESGFYHIYNRGNRKSKIFLDERDYLRFLERAGIYKNKCEVEILCYCLMPNHFHFLLRQKSEIPITKFMLSLATSYSKYFNVKYEEVGRLFQERFQAKQVETDEYLLQLSRYIHLNPHDLTDKIESYDWSSFKFYCDPKNRDTGLVNSKYVLDYFSQKKPREDYLQFVLGESGLEVPLDVGELMIDL